MRQCTRLAAYAAAHGQAALRRARTMGQHVDPDGLHYGGSGPTWSRRTIEAIAADHGLASRRQVAVIDYHTGLGRFGYGEPICGCRPEEPGRDRAVRWYGESLTEPLRGTSTSEVIPGLTQYIWGRAVGAERFTFIALEYGTFPQDVVDEAMREENWLHRHGDPAADTEEARRIRANFVRAFYPATPDWQEMVLWRSRQIIRQTLDGLAQC